MNWLTPELISRLEALSLHVGWVRAGRRSGGRYAVNRRGASVEFSDHMPYMMGDDIRSIDWNLYARLERLYVRKYREEVALSVEIMLDATPSMMLPTAEKWQRAKALAFCLGYIALKEEHHVRVHAVGEGKVQSTRWFSKLHDYRQLSQQIETIQPMQDVDAEAWMRTSVLQQKMHGGQAIWLTDGMIRPAEFFKALHRLVMQHVEPKVIQVITQAELEPKESGVWVDSESGKAQTLGQDTQALTRLVREHNELLSRYCKRNAIAFTQHRVEDDLEDFLIQTLTSQGFLS